MFHKAIPLHKEYLGEGWALLKFEFIKKQTHEENSNSTESDAKVSIDWESVWISKMQ